MSTHDCSTQLSTNNTYSLTYLTCQAAADNKQHIHLYTG